MKTLAKSGTAVVICALLMANPALAHSFDENRTETKTHHRSAEFSRQALMMGQVFFRLSLDRLGRWLALRSRWQISTALTPREFVDVLRAKERLRQPLSEEEIDHLHHLWISHQFPNEQEVYFGLLARQRLTHPTLASKFALYWAELQLQMGQWVASIEDLSKHGITPVSLQLDGELREVMGIGHGARTLDEFITLLKKSGIRTLVDVRSRPQSRFRPWFNRKALTAALAENDIEYLWEGEFLGGKLPELNGDFARYMREDPEGRFTQGMEKLLAILRARSTPVGILCSETKLEDCHRRFILEHLKDHWGTGRPVTSFNQNLRTAA
jgi:hypothetical protein